MNALAREIITLTLDYLGPAAERFIKRQVIAHLHRDLDSLSVEDLPELARWAETSAKLLVGPEKAGELARKILDLQNT